MVEEHVQVHLADPTSAAARTLLRTYMTAEGERYFKRPVSADEVDREIRDVPLSSFAPPHGLLLIASRGDQPLGCVALLLRPEADGTVRLGEIKRMYVDPAARGLGVGSALLTDLEQRARERGLTTLRLDTHTDLVEARRLYARFGYEDTEPFNDVPYSDRWLAKEL
jgi:GNAT superfamily N-acetyltransferase